MKILIIFLVLFTNVICSRKVKVIFHSPSIDQEVSGRSFLIDVEVEGIRVPDEAMGILYMDDNKLMEIRQQQVSISMDGAGGLFEGRHLLRLVLKTKVGREVGSGFVTFLKVGSPEELAGPFHDSKYDDEALAELQEACAPLFASHQPPAQTRGRSSQRNRTSTIAVGMPVVSSRVRYDGEEHDDMRVPQQRDAFIERDDELPLVRIFMPSLLLRAAQERGSYAYRLYLGFDSGDPLFDDAPRRAALDARLRAMVAAAAGEVDVDFVWFRYEGMEGKVFWIYNDLFRQAYEDGADYFFMGNDDLLLLTPGWADRFVAALESSPARCGGSSLNSDDAAEVA